MATARDLIKSALRRISSFGDGEDLSAESADLGLENMNYVFEQWTLDNLMSFQIVQENFPLVINQQSYTIGDGADFDTNRPVGIESAFIRYNGSDYMLSQVNQEGWDSISDKASTSSFPRYFFYRPSFANGTILFYGVPSENCDVYLNVQKYFSAVDLDDVISLPPGYKELMALELAFKLAPQFAFTITKDLRDEHYNLRLKLESRNSGQVFNKLMDTDYIGGTGRYDIYSDIIVDRRAGI